MFYLYFLCYIFLYRSICTRKCIWRVYFTCISARIIYMSRKFHTSVIYTKNRYLYKNPSKNITRLEIKFPKPFTNFQYRSGLKTIIQYRLIPFIIFQYQFGNYDTASFYVLFHFLFIFVSIFKNIWDWQANTIN